MLKQFCLKRNPKCCLKWPKQIILNGPQKSGKSVQKSFLVQISALGSFQSCLDGHKCRQVWPVALTSNTQATMGPRNISQLASRLWPGGAPKTNCSRLLNIRQLFQHSCLQWLPQSRPNGPKNQSMEAPTNLAVVSQRNLPQATLKPDLLFPKYLGHQSNNLSF